MLKHKTAVVFGASGDVGSHICLRLAMEGYGIIGVGTDPATRVGREIEDVGGSFHSSRIDPAATTWEAGFQDVADKLETVNLVVNAGQRDEAALYQDFLGAYRYSPRLRQMLLTLEQVVEIVYQRDDLSVPQPVRSLDGVRLIAIYAENVDRTMHLTEKAEQRILAEGRLRHFSPTLVAGEIVRLLTEEDYREAASIAFQLTRDDVFTALYTVNEGGVPDYARPAKRIWRGHVLKTYLKETRHGKGVFAARDLHKGDLILETTGVVLGHQTEHSMQIGWETHLEPDPPIRLINHSCAPNAGVKTNRLGFPDIVALTNIEQGEEIRFDYAMTEFQHYDRENPGLEFSLRCQCGSPNCRGKLGYYSELPDELKERYRGYLSDYLVQWEAQQAYDSASAR